jgi:hypothetical protein
MQGGKRQPSHKAGRRAGGEGPRQRDPTPAGGSLNTAPTNTPHLVVVGEKLAVPHTCPRNRLARRPGHSSEAAAGTESEWSARGRVMGA